MDGICGCRELDFNQLQEVVKNRVGNGVADLEEPIGKE